MPAFDPPRAEADLPPERVDGLAAGTFAAGFGVAAAPAFDSLDGAALGCLAAGAFTGALPAAAERFEGAAADAAPLAGPASGLAAAGATAPDRVAALEEDFDDGLGMEDERTDPVAGPLRAGEDDGREERVPPVAEPLEEPLAVPPDRGFGRDGEATFERVGLLAAVVAATVRFAGLLVDLGTRKVPRSMQELTQARPPEAIASQSPRHGGGQSTEHNKARSDRQFTRIDASWPTCAMGCHAQPGKGLVPSAPRPQRPRRAGVRRSGRRTRPG